MYRRHSDQLKRYIHGGGWRDPTVTKETFLPAIQHLISTPPYNALVHKRVTAFASINYRLSTHPSHPQNPSTTLPSQYRNALHPDHLHDILTSLSFLQTKFEFGSKYILVGHSCGATLALQAIFRRSLLPTPITQLHNPEVIIGIAGIYDLRLLRDNNSHPAYQEFVSGAFGENEENWDQVSPARCDGIEKVWQEGKYLVLVSSKGDELVDEAQIDVMSEKARSWQGGLKLEVWKGILSQRHDDIWQNGEELGRVIGEGLIKCTEEIV